MKHIKRLAVLCLILASVLGALPVSASDYKLLGTKIDPKKPLNMYLHSNYDKFPADFLQNLNSAIGDWLAIDDRSQLIKVNTKERKDYTFGKLDNHNIISIEADRYNRYLGQAAIWYQDGKVIEADLNINAVHNWTNVEGDTSGMHFYSTVLHELGHILGLDHTESANSCMQPYLGPGETFKIAEVDENGFKAIYYRITSNLEMKDDDLALKTDDKIQVARFYLLPAFDLKELVSSSTLIIKGKVTDISKPITIREADGEYTQDFYNLTVEVSEKINDQMGSAGNKIILRVPTHSISSIKLNEESLFFLIKPTTGGQFITSCDYYMASYGSNSIFALDHSTKTFVNDSGKFKRAELMDIISQKSKCAYSYANDKLNSNLENGFYSANLVSDIMDDDKLYGEIVEGECNCSHTVAKQISTSEEIAQVEFVELRENAPETEKVQRKFDKFFENDTQCFSIEPSKVRGITEVRLNDDINIDNIVLYEYNPTNNSYKKIFSEIHKKHDNFIAFEATDATDYIISEGKLQKK